MSAAVRDKVLLRGEHSDGAVSIVESTMPAGAPGPPLHLHAFDEAFYVLAGELTFQLRDRKTTVKTGELIFAPRVVPHTLANPGDAAARYLLVITPAGFEREFARRAAKEAGSEPPQWALQPTPEVSYLGRESTSRADRARVRADDMPAARPVRRRPGQRLGRSHRLGRRECAGRCSSDGRLGR